LSSFCIINSAITLSLCCAAIKSIHYIIIITQYYTQRLR